MLPIPEEDIVTKWRLQPGKMLLVDLEEGRLIPDEELKATLAQQPSLSSEWLERTQIVLEDLPTAADAAPISNLALLDRQQAFGYTQEDLKILMTPMATTGEEAVGSMGNDTPISALSDKPKLLFTYFKQNFAQVTNPPIDPIREELVMSLVSIIGPRPNLFDLEGTSRTKRLEVRQPILDQRRPGKDPLDLARSPTSHFKSLTLDTTWPAETGAAGMEAGARRALCSAGRARRCATASTSSSCPTAAPAPTAMPIPSLLACAAVHHHLIRAGPAHLGRPRRRIRRAARGAPLRLPRRLRRRGDQSLSRLRDADRDARASCRSKLDEKEVVKRYIKSIDKGLLKVMSKMGISTYQSYCGAQIFDAVGLKAEFVDKYFTGTATRIEGVGARRRSPKKRCAAIATRSATRRSTATMLDVGGEYAFRVRGEDHVWNADHGRRRCSTRCAATPTSSYRHYAQLINEQSEQLLTIRGLFRVKIARRGRPQAGADRGGRAGQGHRQALLHRRHVVRLDLARGAHHARHRHEPHRRQVEHRRRRRGSRPLQAAAERRLDALGDQAGGLRAASASPPSISSTRT